MVKKSKAMVALIVSFCMMLTMVMPGGVLAESGMDGGIPPTDSWYENDRGDICFTLSSDDSPFVKDYIDSIYGYKLYKDGTPLNMEGQYYAPYYRQDPEPTIYNSPYSKYLSIDTLASHKITRGNYTIEVLSDSFETVSFDINISIGYQQTDSTVDISVIDGGNVQLRSDNNDMLNAIERISFYPNSQPHGFDVVVENVSNEYILPYDPSLRDAGLVNGTYSVFINAGRYGFIQISDNWTFNRNEDEVPEDLAMSTIDDGVTKRLILSSSDEKYLNSVSSVILRAGDGSDYSINVRLSWSAYYGYYIDYSLFKDYYVPSDNYSIEVCANGYKKKLMDEKFIFDYGYCRDQINCRFLKIVMVIY
jgi:archaellum component FlaF (FlaF/FlaG flagellin family)